MALLSRIVVMTLIASAMSSGCGGRTQLVPAFQIGRLSSDAVVARDAGIRVMVRMDAWPGPPLDVLGLIPIEMTFDNGSAQELRIRRQDVALVIPAGDRITPLPPSELTSTAPAIEFMRRRSLVDGILAPNERLSGFVYFAEMPEEEEVNLRIDLVSATTAQRFGQIEIPFTLEKS